MDVDASYMISIPILEGTEKSRTVVPCNAKLVPTWVLAYNIDAEYWHLLLEPYSYQVSFKFTKYCKFIGSSLIRYIKAKKLRGANSL